MYEIQLDWKPFNVNLDAVNTAIKALAPTCCGLSADSCLRVHLTEVPSAELDQDIRDYWDAIDSSHSEATSYVSAASVAAAIATQKVAMVSLTWDAMSAAQRKIMLGLIPTKEELSL